MGAVEVEADRIVVREVQGTLVLAAFACLFAGVLAVARWVSCPDSAEECLIAVLCTATAITLLARNVRGWRSFCQDENGWTPAHVRDALKPERLAILGLVLLGAAGAVATAFDVPPTFSEEIAPGAEAIVVFVFTLLLTLPLAEAYSGSWGKLRPDETTSAEEVQTDQQPGAGAREQSESRPEPARAPSWSPDDGTVSGGAKNKRVDVIAPILGAGLVGGFIGAGLARRYVEKK